MISSLSFINQKGEILIYRVYKDDISRNEITQFCAKMIATKENKEFPIINIDQTSFIHIQIKDIIILATTKTNVNVAMVLEFLYQLSKICISYFQGNLDENCIKKSFVLIYEILDEVLDYGIPQIADPNILQKYIQEGVQQEGIINIERLRQLTYTITSAVSWRPIGLYYEKNELYLDIIESVNLLISAKDTVLRSEVVGQIELKSKLTGMPECQIGMNDKLMMGNQSRQNKLNGGITIDDMKFHLCVRLPKFDKDRTITFTPPDGQFQLMSYRISENINIPFKVNVLYNDINENNKLEIRLKIKSIYDKNVYGSNIVIKVPVPKNTVNVISTTAIGKAIYEIEEQSVIWRIKKLQGDFETQLRCEINLGVTNRDCIWSKPPLKMEFQIPMFTASGLRVRFLKVIEKAGYKTNKWIKYLTKGGEYLHRL